MSFIVRPYTETLADKWDAFVMSHAVNGTFLHTRRFLNYHPQGRFEDCSLMIYNAQELCAVIPAAVAAAMFVCQRVRLVDEQHAAYCRVAHMVGLHGGLSHVFRYESGAVGLHQMSFL